MLNSKVAAGTYVCLKTDVLKTEIELKMGFFSDSHRATFYTFYTEKKTSKNLKDDDS